MERNIYTKPRVLETTILQKRKKLPSLYSEYITHLTEVKGLSLGSIYNQKDPVLKFLLKYKNLSSPSKIKHLKATDIHKYVIKTFKYHSTTQMQNIVSALRGFFKFLFLRGYHKNDLSISIQGFKRYRLSSIPRGFSWNTVKLIINAPDRRTKIGSRDYAILLMLATYGIRQNQLRILRFENINWEAQKIFFSGNKRGKDLVVPLTKEVASALFLYFKKHKMHKTLAQGFIFFPYASSNSKDSFQRPLSALWSIVNRYISKLNIQLPIGMPKGPHAIRHAFATKQLSDGLSIKVVSDFLGHRAISSTFIYTKVNLKQLERLTCPWPVHLHKVGLKNEKK
ncbi:MAG: tyrosine-type recombinase/integrase [Oligoflexia bacterium]|nr:tyrosine-type recombinase/integrase [Oligoflexia bacterium]